MMPTSPACRTGSILLFPNISAKRMAVLGPGPRWGLQALSFCAWLASPAPRLGALLSYATKDGGSELAVHSHSGELPGSARFVIGDGQFRELPVVPLLDGKWHHLCLTWSSSQGHGPLLPGEVPSMATGQGLPRGPLLTLANASLQGGVQRVACPGLRHCV
ncbi:PREDICTED: pentraxin-4 [Leptosomus discolor]|uniref:pentraxin-4 n=1 Tax=Leptosomus discolor TaxID=188344 RepID=UPI0005227E95|nr:PREDICTED: pentraxin-4 [Leptosomus discolor]